MTERIEVQRTIAAPAADIFAVLCDPQGHVAIDASGMLQDADGDPVQAVGDSFVVHMDRESLNDFPLGKYDVTVINHRVRAGQGDRLDHLRPDQARRSATCTATDSNPPTTARWSRRSTTGLTSISTGGTPNIFPVVSELALRATLGILDRTVRRGYPRMRQPLVDDTRSST